MAKSIAPFTPGKSVPAPGAGLRSLAAAEAAVKAATVATGSDAYYNALFGAEAGAGVGGAGGATSGVTGQGLANPMLKSAGIGIFATWLLNKILQTKHQSGMRDIQRQGLRSQAEMVTPENIYFQAAQPQAEREETMAHQALMEHLSGGVLGPSLAKGEYLVGG